MKSLPWIGEDFIPTACAARKRLRYGRSEHTGTGQTFYRGMVSRVQARSAELFRGYIIALAGRSKLASRRGACSMESRTANIDAIPLVQASSPFPAKGS